MNQANDAANMAKDEAQLAYDRAQTAKNESESAKAELEELIDRIRAFLTQQGARPADIRAVSQTVHKNKSKTNKQTNKKGHEEVCVGKTIHQQKHQQMQ